MSKIFITGGCGFLGKALLSKWYGSHEIVVFNRDENKQFLMKQQFPYVDYVLGDVRDYEAMKKASRGCSYAVFAASMKHIDMCSKNPLEASSIILGGAVNSRRLVEDSSIDVGCFISTDKANSPLNLYGGLKFCASEIFTLNPPKDRRVVSLAYGNIFNSSGSIILKLNSLVGSGKKAVLYSEEMTRFGMLVKDSVSLIERALFRYEVNGSTLVPTLWSYRVKDLFEIYKEDFGLDYVLGKTREGEKIHEVMISRDSIPFVSYVGELDYVIGKTPTELPETSFDSEYSSENEVVTKGFLREFLKNNNYFKE
jgi:UDP-glucose 4-epimerase